MSMAHTGRETRSWLAEMRSDVQNELTLSQGRVVVIRPGSPGNAKAGAWFEHPLEIWGKVWGL